MRLAYLSDCYRIKARKKFSCVDISKREKEIRRPALRGIFRLAIGFNNSITSFKGLLNECSQIPRRDAVCMYEIGIGMNAGCI